MFLQVKKGAFQRLFCCSAALLLLASAACGGPVDSGTSTSATACTAPAFAETADIRHVHDGDTVQLNDGRKLRLIGIDTPELARGGKSAQPFASAARDHLRRLLQEHGDRVGLVFDSQREDRYRRTLAHLFFTNGESVAAAMLGDGFAVAYTTPPNSRFSSCYRDQEASARSARSQIWDHAKYQPQAVSALAATSDGFHIIRARVLRSNTAGTGVWLNLEGGLAIQTKTADLDHFPAGWLAALQGKTIEVRGWLHPNRKAGKSGFYMQLRHPDNLIVLATP